MLFRVEMTLEVDQVGNALAIRTPVKVSLICQKEQWKFECECPRVETDWFDSMEEALKVGARQVAREKQLEVINRPVIAGRITPEMVPKGRF